METYLISKQCLTNDKLSDLNIITAKNNGQLKALAVLSLRIEGEACSTRRSKYRRNKLNFMLNFFRLCRNLCLRQKMAEIRFGLKEFTTSVFYFG